MAEIKSMGVVGGGQMGSGIAQLAAVNGITVWLHDTDAGALTRALSSISDSIQRFVSKGQLSQEVKTEALRCLRCTSNLEDLASADIVIEAIVESEDVKKSLFVQLDKIVKKSAILASNTSSISITRLAAATGRPQQVIGMHFMNPPPIMKLVEIVRGADTSEDTFNVTKALAERFGKTVICSQDYSGFIVNRILMPMINEAFHALYTGVATKEDIDTGMKLGTNHPMGPLELADFIGLDVCLSIMKVLHAGLGDTKYVPCPLLVQLVDAGRLGRKREKENMLRISVCIVSEIVVLGGKFKKEKEIKMEANNMVVSSSSDALLVKQGNDGVIIDKRWWSWTYKLLDMEEAKRQVLFSLPMIITNVCYYAIPLISVMFAGHLGQLQLASSNLANSWATVTGFSFMVGLSGALETLCGQGYGAKLYGMLGIYLQASCIISIVFSIIISTLWIYTEPILGLLHQDPEISKAASLYIVYLIPGLFAYGVLHNILRFLQTQSVVIPLVVCSVIPSIIHIGITYVLVQWTSLGFVGAPLAASISLWISVLMLASYVLYAKKFKQTWEGFSWESFSHVFGNLKLALPSAAMVCLEYWAFELLVLLAGVMPNADVTTSLIAMCVNTEAVAYMFTYGLSASASTRVSNELGAGNSEKAKHAMKVTLKLSIILAVAVVLALGFGHDIWAASFSDSSIIIKEFASITPLLVISIVVDSIQGILSGVARGCGWQHLAVYINLAMFYFIGMPIAMLLGFKLKLYAKGLWLGLICGLSCQAGSLLLLTRFGTWNKMELTGSRHAESAVLV